jgi:glycosyltransferase involved in cell wall biosynthesis
MLMKNILICIDCFEPAYKFGGPIKSVKNLISKFKDDFNLYVFTSNLDSGENLDLPKDELDTWLIRDEYKIYYSSNNSLFKKKYNDIFSICSFDVIYLNSIFSFNYSLRCLMYFRNNKNKIILAPRGMLAPGALSIKPIKKKLFLFLFKLLKLHKKVLWHATSDLEYSNIKLSFKTDTLRIQLVPNLSNFIDVNLIVKEKKEYELNIFYVSRIVSNKNLLFAISSLDLVDSKYKVVFTIIGPVEDYNYWNLCQNKIKALNKNIEVVFLGSLKPKKITEILKDQHVLLFPTLHENFGHVIMESWESGCPVIISDKTPWRNLSLQKLGFDINLNLIEDFVSAIEKFSIMNKDEYSVWSESSLSFSKTHRDDNHAQEKMKNIFK